MKAFVVLLLAGNFLLCQSGSIQRNKRGYLSRTGLCAKPEENFHIKDPRLNFWGVAYVLPDDANPKCTESECSEDSHCDADRKCCKNYCGGKVCTPTTRDPNPCKKFKCPTGQTCKIQYVPCVMPKCQDAVAVNRPTCIKDPAAPAPAAPASPLSAPNPAGPETTPYGPANPAMYPQQPSPYQPQQQYAPAPFAPPMPPMGPMAGFQNDEPGAGSEAGFQGGLGGEQPNFDTAFNDAPALGAAMQNENQPLTFQNESPLTSEPSNFFQPPAEEQQPLATEPVSQLPADMYAPRRAWDRSSKSHGQ